MGKYAYSLIITACHELLAMWRVVHTQHSVYVVLVDVLGLIELAHVEGVGVAVLVADSEIDRFVRVPAQAAAFAGCNACTNGRGARVVRFGAGSRRDQSKADPAASARVWRCKVHR